MALTEQQRKEIEERAHALYWEYDEIPSGILRGAMEREFESGRRAGLREARQIIAEEGREAQNAVGRINEALEREEVKGGS